MFETIIIVGLALYLVVSFKERGVLLPVVKFLTVVAVLIGCGVIGFFHVIGQMDAVPAPPAGYELIPTLSAVRVVTATAQPVQDGHVYGDGAISLWLTVPRR